jgi:hypothetical protein
VSYVGHVARFARCFRQSLEALGAVHGREYQLHLINEKRLVPTLIVL